VTFASLSLKVAFFAFGFPKLKPKVVRAIFLLSFPFLDAKKVGLFLLLQKQKKRQ
jgi:hypothetical protein